MSRPDATAPKGCDAGSPAGCGCLPCAQGRAAASPVGQESARLLAGILRQSWIGPSPAGDARAFASQSSESSEGVATYKVGDPFPTDPNECGWTVVEYAATLSDAMVCTAADGTVASKDLSFFLSVASTCTIELPTGGFRMYFAYPKLFTAKGYGDPATRFREWPVEDSTGALKFHVTSSSFPDDRPRTWMEGREWWNPDEMTSLPYERNFSPVFVSYLDSADGVTWTINAPRVRPVSGTTCEDADYTDAVAEFDSGRFFAGWRSTAIPSAGQVVTYRDPSVVYLKGVGRFIMFAVRCDGTGLAASGADAYYTVDPLGPECDTCTPPPCLDTSSCTPSPCLSTTPVTDIVFFSCRDPNFQREVSGPFRAISLEADAIKFQWFGVPQAFLSPDGDYVFLHAVTTAGGGLWAAPVAPFGAAVLKDEGELRARGAVDYTTFKGGTETFQLLGDVVLHDTTATSPSDPHFVFAPDGTLNLFFTMEDPAVPGTLRWIAQARAKQSYMAAMLDELFFPEPDEGAAADVQIPNGHEIDIDGFEWEPDYPSITEMFLDLYVTCCPPIDGQELVDDSDAYIDRSDVEQKMSVHDPNVYIAADGTVQMLFYTLHGLVRAWANSTDAWDADIAPCP